MNMQKIFSNQFPVRAIPHKSKTNGILLIDGHTHEYNKPFPILNYLKETKYKYVLPRNRIKIVSVMLK